MDKPQQYLITDYQNQRPFASFLSGIAGKYGKPLWAFYVNRGQGLASFGLKDKNGAITEFFPANAAYREVSRLGFRTFIRLDHSIVVEFFATRSPTQKMSIYPEGFSIEETNLLHNLKIKVSYSTLPQESIAGLVRKVEITNLSTHKRHFEVVDGLPQIYPRGVDFGALKSMSNLMQSWFESINNEDFVFYQLRASTEDKAEVSHNHAGNYYLTKAQDQVFYISDPYLIFEQDSSLTEPRGLQKHTYPEIIGMEQVHVNTIPCAFSYLSVDIEKEYVFYSLIGSVDHIEEVDTIAKRVSQKYFEEKEVENQLLHQNLTSDITTKTNQPLFDEYVKQCYLDNIIRGGKPLPLKTKEGDITYYLYSRRHGDLERDYNFFVIEPNYYSQGNGNFRDVLQNRRNDVYFAPFIHDFNIHQFFSFIQADGYNPLSVEGLKFRYQGKKFNLPLLDEFLTEEFTPGTLYEILKNLNFYPEENFPKIIQDSTYEFKAVFGEGYWGDHFSYLLDLLTAFLDVYPDEEKDLLFINKYQYFFSPIYVRPRSEKYVLNKNKEPRQYHALTHIDKPSSWLTDGEGKKIVGSLFSKILTLVVNKYAILDQDGLGLSFEGDKPGWNDAMNGLPGLFGSGASETIELQKILLYLLPTAHKYQDETILILKDLLTFIRDLSAIKEEGFKGWEARSQALEKYREALKSPQSNCKIEVKEVLGLLTKIHQTLKVSLEKLQNMLPVLPTYFTYQAQEYTPKGGKVDIHSFKMAPLPPFLEAPARFLTLKNDREIHLRLYKNIKNSLLYDPKYQFYVTSVPLDNTNHEIGRIRAFTPGWLERESNFLHMTYKYLLGLLKAGLYDEYYTEIKTNFTCFMDPAVYGRNPLENSSFIASSRNPDPRKHGQGFYARLSGSTSELISMWKLMFFGPNIFTLDAKQQLIFRLSPRLNQDFFLNGRVETTLFSQIKIIYENLTNLPTYDEKVKVTHYILTDANGKRTTIHGDFISQDMALAIRNLNIHEIQAFIGYK